MVISLHRRRNSFDVWLPCILEHSGQYVAAFPHRESKTQRMAQDCLMSRNNASQHCSKVSVVCPTESYQKFRESSRSSATDNRRFQEGMDTL